MSVGAGVTVHCPVCGSDDSRPLWRDGEWQLVTCAHCDMVFVANPPDEEQLAELYSVEAGFHADLVEGEPAEAIERAARHHLAKVSEVQRPGRLLDVGCATGSFMKVAAAAGWDVKGVELNDGTAAKARASGLDVMTGTLEQYPQPEQPFDAVTMWDVVEHVPDPVGLLAQARRLLGPDGWLWLATPNVDGIFPRASLKLADRLGVWPHPEPPYHLSQFSERTIRHALARAGFTDVVVFHERIPLGYTFGTPRKVVTEPKRLAYTALFAPLALAGPLVRRGDTMLLAARTG